jgi:hypothetical protein
VILLLPPRPPSLSLSLTHTHTHRVPDGNSQLENKFHSQQSNKTSHRTKQKFNNDHEKWVPRMHATGVKIMSAADQQSSPPQLSLSLASLLSSQQEHLLARLPSQSISVDWREMFIFYSYKRPVPKYPLLLVWCKDIFFLWVPRQYICLCWGSDSGYQPCMSNQLWVEHMRPIVVGLSG